MKKILYILTALIIGTITFAESTSAQTALPVYVAPTPMTPAASPAQSAPAAVSAPIPATSAVSTSNAPAAPTPIPTAPKVTAAPTAVTVPVATTNTSAAQSNSVIIPTVKPVDSLSTIKPVIQKASTVVDPLSSLNAPSAKVKATSGSDVSSTNEPNTTGLQLLVANTKNASNVLGGALAKLVSARGKIAARVSLAKNKGVPAQTVADLQAKLDISDVKLAEARTFADNLSIVPVSKGDVTTILTALQATDMAARQSIRQAQDSLRGVLATLVAAESTIKK